MKQFIVLSLLSIGLSACAGGGADSAASAIGPAPNPGPTPTVQSVTLKRGRGFECFILSSTVWCRGSGTNPDIGLTNPTGFVPFFESDSPVVSLETFDDTICVTLSVLARPYSRTPGLGTYCVGEATLGGAISAFPAIYSGPNFTPGMHDSSDFDSLRTPMMGGDFPMSDLVNSTFMTDGSGFVSSAQVSCLLSEDELVCPGFSVDLQ